MCFHAALCLKDVFHFHFQNCARLLFVHIPRSYYNFFLFIFYLYIRGFKPKSIQRPYFEERNIPRVLPSISSTFLVRIFLTNFLTKPKCNQKNNVRTKKFACLTFMKLMAVRIKKCVFGLTVKITSNVLLVLCKTIIHK